jgi:hypothetical protein
MPKIDVGTMGQVPFNKRLAMDCMEMTDRKSPGLGRGRRQRFFLQLLAAMGVGICGAAVGQDTELAYYQPDPSQVGEEIQMVAADETQSLSLRTILQTSALMPQEPEALPQPVVIPEDVPVPKYVPIFDDLFPENVPFLKDVPVPEDVPVPSSSDQPAGDGFLSGPDNQEDSHQAEDADVDPFADEAMMPPGLVPPQSAVTADALFVPVASSRRPSLGATAGSYSVAPNMIGDHFGGTFLFGVNGRHTVSLAGGDRRFKIAENVSPVPQDRIFFNYNHFENSVRDVNNVNRSLDRFTFGFEKTFWDGNASLEARLPFASGLNSSQTFGVADTQATELGNLALAFKANLLSGCNWMLSGGTGISIPTGDDFEVYRANALELRVKNDAVHLSPFIGYLNQLNRDAFFQGFIQADFDLSGNDVFTAARGFEGIVQDQNLLFIDASLGRWIHRNCHPCDSLTGIAALAELHYTTTMNDADTVGEISNPFNRMDILNASAALNFQFRETSLRVGAAAPLRNDEERLFDAEIIFQLNRKY